MDGSPTREYDAVIVGARCAGASTARLLASRGHDVMLLDRATLPSDTLSTHGIARGGVVQLSRWGLLDKVVADGAPPVREVRFGNGVSEKTAQVRDRAGVDMLLAPRRSRLDALLVAEAVAAGATLQDRTTATGLIRDAAGRVIGVTTRRSDGTEQAVTARHVVAADGLRSTLAPLLCARTRQGFEVDASLYFAYVADVPLRAFEFHIGPGAYAGVFPTHDDQACVWLTRPTRHLERVRTAGANRAAAWLAALADAAPGLAARVGTGRIASPVRGWVAPPSYVRDAWGPGWALVGDAGYYRDPITGHGMTDAFRDAELLADALGAVLDGSAGEHESLSRYEADRDHALRDTYRLTRELSSFPAPSRFVELQMELSEALDQEAVDLASRPAPAGSHAVAAA